MRLGFLHHFRQNSAGTLFGRYKIIKQIGAGDRGRHFLARDLQSSHDAHCIVEQIIPTEQIIPAENKERARRAAWDLFAAEVDILRRLNGHPGIPQLLDSFEEAGKFYLVRSPLKGHPLSTELDAATARWTDQQLVAFLGDTLGTLAFAHQQGVMHLDIQPSNLIRKDSDGRMVLTNFRTREQVATPVSDAGINLIGSHSYMPAEQIAGRAEYSSDVYALGMIAVKALTQTHPDAVPAEQSTGEFYWYGLVSHHSHPALVSLLDRMVRRDVGTRYATASSALSALKALPPELSQFVPSPIEKDVEEDIVAASTAPATMSSPFVLRVWPGLAACLLLGLAGWGIFSHTSRQGSLLSAQVSPSVPDENEDSTQAAVKQEAVKTEDTTLGNRASDAGPKEAPQEIAPSAAEYEVSSEGAIEPETAKAMVNDLYDHIADRSWNAVFALLGEPLANQFAPEFFAKFQQVSVYDVRVVSQTADTIELACRNTFTYLDGSTQQEERLYTVQLINGKPRIIASSFVQVVSARN